MSYINEYRNITVFDSLYLGSSLKGERGIGALGNNGKYLFFSPLNFYMLYVTVVCKKNSFVTSLKKTRHPSQNQS